MTSDLACAESVELMTEYLEGALPPAELQRLEEHLATCSGCTEHLAQLRAIAASLGGFTEASLPPAMRERLIAAFRDRS